MRNPGNLNLVNANNAAGPVHHNVIANQNPRNQRVYRQTLLSLKF